MKDVFFDKMLDCISDMQSNLEMSALKVEFINRYALLTYSPASCELEYVFVDQYCTKDLATKSHMLTVDALYDTAYNDFQRNYLENMTDDKLLELEKEDRKIGYADRVFITYVKMFLTISQYIDDLYDWAAERVARTVLQCMQKYFTEYWNSGETAEEYFLGCLMTEVGM